jgi:hypothetical protein
MLGPDRLSTPTEAAPAWVHNPKGMVFYPKTVGATWVYRCGDRDETEVVAGVAETADGTEVHVGLVQPDARVTHLRTVLVNTDGLFVVGGEGGQTYAPPLELLRPAVEPGVRWQTWSLGWPNREEVVYTLVAGRPERVSVPAGWYWALSVEEAQGTVNGVDQKGPYTAWYAPGVGLVKLAHRGRTITELKSFRLAG